MRSWGGTQLLLLRKILILIYLIAGQLISSDLLAQPLKVPFDQSFFQFGSFSNPSFSLFNDLDDSNQSNQFNQFNQSDRSDHFNLNDLTTFYDFLYDFFYDLNDFSKLSPDFDAGPKSPQLSVNHPLRSGAVNSTWATFDFQALRDLVQSKRISTVDDLVAALPADLKRNPLLIYSSLALKADLVSFETPRIILFNRDASLILSISRNPGSKAIAEGRDSIEGLAYDKKTEKWFLFDEVFDGENVPFQTGMRTNQEVCLKCHGANPRPLVHDYNAWPGFYGSFASQGVSLRGSPEYQGLRSFLSQSSNRPRYRELDLGGFYETSLGIAYSSRGFSQLHDALAINPNLAFGGEVEKLMSRRLAEKIIAHSYRSEVAEDLLPVFMYLGEDPKELAVFGVVESRCGHPSDRTKRVYQAIASAHPENSRLLFEIERKLQEQVLRDHVARVDELSAFNSPSREVSSEGVAAIVYKNFFSLNSNVNLGLKLPSDSNSTSTSNGDHSSFMFRQQMVVIEALFRKLRFKTEDLSTSNRLPTTGLFHASRLGGSDVSAQYFQNLMPGFRAAAPRVVGRFERLSCEELEETALSGVERVFSEKIDSGGLGVLHF